MLQVHLIWIFHLSLLLLSSGANAYAASEDNSAYVSVFSCNSGPLKLTYGIEPNKYKVLGPPLNQITLKDSNGLQYRKVEYKGLTLVFHMDTDQAGLLASIVMTSPVLELVDGVKIGDPPSIIKSRLGKAVNIDKTIIEVCGDTDCAKFHTRDKKIFKIEYSCYTG